MIRHIQSIHQGWRYQYTIHIEPNEDEIRNTNVEHENSGNKNGNGTVVIVEMKLVKMKPQMADILVVKMRIMEIKSWRRERPI